MNIIQSHKLMKNTFNIINKQLLQTATKYATKTVEPCCDIRMAYIMST